VGTLAGENAWFGLFIFCVSDACAKAPRLCWSSPRFFEHHRTDEFPGHTFWHSCRHRLRCDVLKGSVRINLQSSSGSRLRFVLVAAQLFSPGCMKLSESGVLPSSKREMAIIGPIVRNELFSS